MALTRASIFCRNALKREHCLKEPRDITKVPYGKIVTQEQAKEALQGYASSGSLKKSDIMECISILKDAESKGPCKVIANYIANEIIPHSICEDIDLSSLSPYTRIIIESSIENITICDRILENQSILEKRFNISNLCKGKDAKSASRLLCESIDTYNIPLSYKFNIALENVMFSLVKNNVPFNDDIDIANYVVEYFVNRDSNIYDSTYKTFQNLIQESELYDTYLAYGYTKALLENSGNYYGDKVTKIFKEANDERLYEFADMFNSIITESDAERYIKTVADFVHHNQVTTLDKNRIYYSIDSIANHSGIDRSYIKMVCNDLFGDELSEKRFDVDFPDKSPDVFASVRNIEDIIIETESSQCKDHTLLENMYNSIICKPTNSIFGKTYDILNCARKTLCLSVINKDCDINKACESTLKFINRLYAQTFNFAQVAELNNNIKTLFFSLPETITNIPEVEKLIKDLEKIVDVNADTSISEEADIYQCFDNYTDVIDAFSKLAVATESMMRKQVDSDSLKEGIEYCIQNKCLSSFYEIYSYCNQPITIFESAYSDIYDPKVMRSFEDIRENTDIHIDNKSLKSLFLMIEAMEVFMDLGEGFDSIREVSTFDIKQSASAVNNKVQKGIDTNKKIKQRTNDKFKKKGTNFITTLKLGLQVLKKKAKEFDTKQKSMWRTLDAYGSKFSRILEEDDDKRRAQLIQGQAIPTFSQCMKSGLALMAAGVITGNVMIPIITGFGMMGTNKFLNDKQRKQLIEEIEIELNIVSKQLDMAEKEDDLKTYRQLLMVQRKLQHEAQRLRFKRKSFKLGRR